MKILYDLILPIFFVTILSLFATKSIKNNSKYYYLVSLFIAAISTTYEVYKIIFGGSKLTGVIYQLERISLKGFLALGCFLLVMFCGAMNTKWNITKKLLSIRGQLAIIGSILMIPHFVVYTTKFIMKLLGTKPISPLNYIYIIMGLLAFIILIPLFLTSFKFIRKKMNPITWKNLQRWSYLFFLLVYLHIAVLLLAAKEFNIAKFSLYTFVFLLYTVLRINKANHLAKLKHNSISKPTLTT
ncbi:ferric reductase-like transmembrane domain-containing protein [uncultured Clostridium sp.]|uniref:ferric reductase-like transmembrane domain-containing protein n=1 Tax=uncultured Clostridium sp. TaxID=59620 RepID=UPI002582A748|nr:ferric reductase-like transmembrane domain-containing protein [uncultured Clostridium sp.]